MKIIFGLVVAAVVGTCSPTDPANDGSVRFVLSETVVAPGDILAGSLVNRSAAPIGYNLCVVALDRRTDSEWEQVTATFGVPPGGACILPLLTLEPGGTAPYRQQLPRDFAAGRYRLRVRVEVPIGGGSNDVVLTTQTFTVTS